MWLHVCQTKPSVAKTCPVSLTFLNLQQIILALDFYNFFWKRPAYVSFGLGINIYYYCCISSHCFQKSEHCVSLVYVWWLQLKGKSGWTDNSVSALGYCSEASHLLKEIAYKSIFIFSLWLSWKDNEQHSL